jgi:hypothetical protein
MTTRTSSAPYRFALPFACALLAGCVFNSPEYSLAHAYVTPWTRLPKDQIQEIVRVISHSSTQAIIGISQSSPKGNPAEVDVYTGNPDGTSPYYWNYTLKRSGGTWHIVNSGQMSFSVIGLALNIPPKER